MNALHIIGTLIASLLVALPALGFVLAVDPTSRRPGVGVLINLRTGSSTSAGGAIRYLLIGVKNAATGTTTPEDAVHEDVLPEDVSALCGPGGLTHLAAQRLFEENPIASVDLVVMAAPSGNTATGTITFTGDASAVTADRTVLCNVVGVQIDSVWLVGETAIQAATRLVSKINAKSRRLPVIASNSGGASAAVLLTAKSKGKWGLDVRYRCVLTDGSGGTVATAGAKLTGGSTEPDVAAVLLLLQSEYRLIVPCLSNADLATATTSSNMGKLKAYIAGNNAGIGARLQTAITAPTDSTSNAKAMSGQHDFEYFNHTLGRGAESLPAELGGAIAGLYGREIKLDANHPFVKATFNDRTDIYGSAALNTDALSAAEAEDLLNSGVSYIEYTAQRRPRLARPISTYFEDADGNPDDRILDISKVYGMIAVAADLRVECERTFQGKKLMKTLPSGRTPIPPGIVGESDAKSFILGRIRSQWVKAGVVNGTRLDEAVNDGSLIVQVDETDETQLDVFLPLRIIPPLVKTSLTFVQA